MKKILLIILVIPVKIIAQINENIKIEGQVEADQISYFNSHPSKINSRNEINSIINISSTETDNHSFYLSTEVRNDMSDRTRDRINLYEGYVNLKYDNADVRIGKQIITWGEADAVNYTNNINPTDYSDILDTDGQNIGVFALSTKYYINNFTLQAVIIPVFQPSVFPNSQSPWMRELPSVIPVSLGANTINMKASYEYLRPNVPKANWDNAQYALKIQSSLSGWDFSLSYYRGINDVPLYNLKKNVVANDSLHIQIESDYVKWDVIGGDFATTLSKIGLRGEGALFIKDNDEKPYFQYVVGMDYTFVNMIGNNNLTILAQWLDEITSKNVSYSVREFNHIFQRSVMLRITQEMGINANFTLQAVYNAKGKDYYFQPELTYKIKDGLNLNILADILGGDSEGFFGSYKKNNRIQTRLTYFF